MLNVKSHPFPSVRPYIARYRQRRRRQLYNLRPGVLRDEPEAVHVHGAAEESDDQGGDEEAVVVPPVVLAVEGGEDKEEQLDGGHYPEGREGRPPH